MLAFAQMSDVAPTDMGTEGSCTNLYVNFGYRATDRTTSGSVSLLQDFLISKGYLNSESTGNFGALTLKAVKAYQETKGFGATGYVGKYTRTAITTDTCSNSLDRMPYDPVPPTNGSGGTSSGGDGTQEGSPYNTYKKPGTTGVNQTSSSMKVTVLDSRGKPSLSSYFKCGNKTTRDYILRAPNSNGEVTFNPSDCRKKGTALWISCPVGQVANFSSETLADFKDQMVVTCATADYIKIAADVVAQSKSVASSTTTLVTGTYLAYFDNSQTPFITTQNLSEAAAQANCTTNRTSNPADRPLRCTWNGKEIANYAGFPAPAITGVYLAYLDGSQSPFITTQNLTEAAAVSNCNTNRANNPGHALKCVWNGKVVGEYASELTSTFYINGKEVSGGIIALSGGTVLLEWKSTGANTCNFNGENLGATSGTRSFAVSSLTTSSHTYTCTSVTGQVVSKTFSISVPGTCNDTGTASNGAMCAPPAPTLSLKINGRGIARDESVSLTTNQAVVEWESINARSCALDNQTIPTSGSNTSTGLTTRSYVYKCTNSVGVSTSMPFSIVVSGSGTGVGGSPTLAVYINDVRVAEQQNIQLTTNSARVRWESSGASTCKLNDTTIPTSGSNTSTGLTSQRYVYTCTGTTGLSSSVSFSITTPSTPGTDGGMSEPMINQFSLDKPNLPSNQSATLSFSFWALGLASEKAMACNILTYNKATRETQAGNTIVANTLETAGSFQGTRTYAGKDYPSGATITVNCRNPAGSASRSVELNVVAPVVATPVPTNVKIFVNGTNNTSLTVTEGDTIRLSWSADNVASGGVNAGVYYFYVDNIRKGPFTVTSSSASTNDFGFTVGTHSVNLVACNGIMCSAESSPLTIIVNPRAVATTWVNAAARCADWVGRPSSLISSGPNPIPSNYTVGNISYQYDSANVNNIRNINTSSCSAPVYVPPAITWVNGSTQCQQYVGVPSSLITSGPNPIPSGYTLGTISYEYDSANVNNVRNLNTSGCYAPASGPTWINATAPCSRFVGITSSLITSGPNPIPSNYVYGTISYQYDSANIDNIRNINTSACSASAMLNTATPLASIGASLEGAFSTVSSNITRGGEGLFSLLSGATRASAATDSSNTATQPVVVPVNVSPKTCVNITSNLHRGNETGAVSKLQSFLVSKGLLVEKVSGFYGDKTIESVKAYQRNVGLPGTGMVYGATRAAIMEETCN